MTEGNVTFDSNNYGSGQASDTPPTATTPDTPPTPGSPMDAALAVFHAAANGDDPANDAELAALYGDRELQYGEDLAKFPASEDKNSSEMMAQAFPQLISGLAGALTGAIGGIVQPLTQLPQSALQAGQGALQTGMGALQQSGGDLSGGGDLEFSDEDMLDDPSLYDELGGMYDGLGGYGDTGGGGGGGGSTGGGGTEETGPTSALAPPVAPISTFPAAAPPTVTPPAPAASPSTPHMGGMGGMPYMPMGGAGAGGATPGAGDNKTDTKKVVPPVIKNAKAVTGRLVPNSRLEAPTVRQASAANAGPLSSRTAKRSQETPKDDEGGGSK